MATKQNYPSFLSLSDELITDDPLEIEEGIKRFKEHNGTARHYLDFLFQHLEQEATRRLDKRSQFEPLTPSDIWYFTHYPYEYGLSLEEHNAAECLRCIHEIRDRIEDPDYNDSRDLCLWMFRFSLAVTRFYAKRGWVNVSTVRGPRNRGDDTPSILKEEIRKTLLAHGINQRYTDLLKYVKKPPWISMKRYQNLVSETKKRLR